MAYIIHRKITEPSAKKSGKWIPPNRKYKYLFWILLSIDALGLICYALLKALHHG